MSYSLQRSLATVRWVHLALLLGGVIAVLWSQWAVWTLSARIARDVVLFILAPGALAVTYGRRIGWRVDRLAIRNTVLLSLFALPFYVVGSSLPTIRTHYPMWSTTAAFGDFLPHAASLFLLALATETYYRGLLCVGVNELGFKCVFISPVLYAFHHLYKPPIEFLLSGPTDVLFGAVDYKSGSILPSVVAHGGGLVLLDWLVLRPPLLPPEQILEWLSWVPIPL